MTRQPSAQITSRPTPTSAALADIRSQRTMPSACGGALPASSALRTEPASVPVSFRPPGCSPTTDLARFAVRSSGFRGRQAGPSQAAPSSSAQQIAGTFPGSETSQEHPRAGLGRAIARLPALARFAPRSLVLDLADQVSTHLCEGMIKVALVGGGHEVRPSR